MAGIILAVNAGSSSVKTAVFRAERDGAAKRLAAAEVAGLNDAQPSWKYKRGEHEQQHSNISDGVKSHEDAIHYIFNHMFSDPELQEVGQREDITYVCHRVVHGGDYARGVLITPKSYHHIEALEDLAPLHNASALAILRSCAKDLPQAKNIAYFDTTFHSTLPEAARTYAINQTVARERGLRKYGFHGLSYGSILRSTSSFLGKPAEQTSIIALHLGSGASACAIRNGKSLDTSMGLTPLSGLPGSSRSGDIDPSLVFHYTSEAGKLSPKSTKELHITNAEAILNTQSGWKALTGTSDFAQIGTPSASGQHRLAFEIFVDRIVGFVGSYFVRLEGRVDALVFAGGIGEKSSYLRAEVVKRCECLGFKIDTERNDSFEDELIAEISNDTASGPKVLVCHTDEEGEMARLCVKNPSPDS